MDSLELVVRLPVSWDQEQVEDLASALGEALDRFPRLSVEVRAASPGLLAEVDQLKAMARETEVRLKRAESGMKWLRAPWGPFWYWAAGFGTGVGVTLTLVNLIN